MVIFQLLVSERLLQCFFFGFFLGFRNSLAKESHWPLDIVSRTGYQKGASSLSLTRTQIPGLFFCEHHLSHPRHHAVPSSMILSCPHAHQVRARDAEDYLLEVAH